MQNKTLTDKTIFPNESAMGKYSCMNEQIIQSSFSLSVDPLPYQFAIFFGLWNETSIRLFPFSLSNSFASAALVVSVCFSFDFSTSWMLFFSAIQIPHRNICRRNGQEANTDTNIQIRLTSHFHRNFSIVLLFLCVCIFTLLSLCMGYFCERNFIDV